MEIKKFKYYREEPNDYIFEGIDIDRVNKKVSINLTHENGLDTSIINNPTYYNLDGIDVISIFRRKRHENSDGNPLLYALKGLNDWQIENFDIKLLMQQFITIIKIPSNNELNNKFMDRLNKIIKCKDKIDFLLSKLDKEVVYENGVDWQNMTPDQVKLIDQDFLLMDEETFSFKHIRTYLRKYIKKIYTDNWIHNELDVADKINGKNVLILDDTVSSVTTISLFTKGIIEMYDPYKITVVTLLSLL